MSASRVNGYLEREFEREPKKDKYIKPWHFPEDIIVLFYQGKINPRELCLLGVINALTHTRPDGTIKRCFASNKYLSKLVGVSKNNVSIMISRLVAEGIVIRTTKQKENGDEQRYLKPIWRRTFKPLKQ